MDFIERIDLVSKEFFNKKAFIFLEDGIHETATLTFQQLSEKAKRIATQLIQRGLSGKRVILLYPHGLDVILAFLACLYAKVIAIPVAPINHIRHKEKLKSIINDSATNIVFMSSHFKSMDLKSVLDLEINLEILFTDSFYDVLYSDELSNRYNGSDIAFIQYTSGSTGFPKGVMVTHENLLTNQQMIANAFAHTSQSIIMGWLPFYHDMGLIGNILHPIYMGCTCILMSPEMFAQKPHLWLQAISKYRATTSGGPNFAYDLCNRKISADYKKNLDLSNWKIAFNGSEPIHLGVMNTFVDNFSTCGFKREAFYPCYGMAEATLLISGSSVNTPPIYHHLSHDALKANKVEFSKKLDDPIIVGCGKAVLEQKIEIVNVDGFTKCLANEIGEIWVAGKNITKGYWGKSEKTKETFDAYMADGQGPFLRTGDLGFKYKNELFVTGRMKDLIIIRGCNYYPQDIENTIQKNDSRLRPHRGAAFSLQVNNQEELAIAQEIERSCLLKLNSDEVIHNIRQIISECFGLSVHTIVLIKPGNIPKTSSGKIKRKACHAMLMNKSYKMIAISTINSNLQGSSDSQKNKMMDDLEFHLRQKFATLLKIEPSDLNLHQPLSRLGLDSLMIQELINSIELHFGLNISMQDIFESENLKDLVSGMQQKHLHKQPQLDWEEGVL